MNIEDLDKLAKWMRTVGAQCVVVREPHSEVQLTLGHAPDAPHAPPREMTDEEAAAALKRDKERLDKLLFASSEGFPDDFEDT